MTSGAERPRSRRMAKASINRVRFLRGSVAPTNRRKGPGHADFFRGQPEAVQDAAPAELADGQNAVGPAQGGFRLALELAAGLAVGLGRILHEEQVADGDDRSPLGRERQRCGRVSQVEPEAEQRVQGRPAQVLPQEIGHPHGPFLVQEARLGERRNLGRREAVLPGGRKEGELVLAVDRGQLEEKVFEVDADAGLLLEKRA
jgi:hypothetical protein